MYRKLISFVVTVTASWAGSAASAADTGVSAKLTAVEGSVVMNQGKRFVPAKLGTELIEGDRILALKTGHATVTFGDGCAILIKPGKLMTVGPQSPCSDGTGQERQDEGLLGGDTIPGANDHRPPNKTPPTEGVLVPALIGAVVVGIGGSCLAEAWPCDGGHHHRRSVSP